MSISYNYSTDWINRDSQPDASPLRVIKAIDFLNEWTAIQNAFGQAAPSASPTFTGTATFEGLTSSSATVNGDLTVTGTINGGSLNTANWDTAYSWGDHAAAGYLTSFTETDPTVPSHVKNITTTDISNWDAAAGLGDWTGEGFLTSVSFADIEATSVLLSSEGWTNVNNQVVTPAAVDARITSRTSSFITGYSVTQGDVTQHQAALSITESQISDFGSYLTDAPSDGTQYARLNGAWTAVSAGSGGTVTSVNATTPIGLSVSGGPITGSGTLAFSFTTGYSIPTNTKQGQWDTAYGWGDHSTAGYALNNGSNASGSSWNIGILGNAATATTATTAGSCTGNSATATTATNCSRTITAGTNLTGGGALTANRTISLNSTLTNMTDVQTNNLSIGSWDIKLDGSDLRFVYNNTDVFRITTTGAIIAKDNVTAYGAP